MVSIQPIRIEVEREEDGRVLAAVPELPGVMAYDVDADDAIRKVKASALQVLADMIDSVEEVPGVSPSAVCSVSVWRAVKASRVQAALLRNG